MSLSYRIDAVTFSDGTALVPPERGIVVLVGANNVGKSLGLRELHAFLGSPPHPLNPPKVVVDVRARKEGTREDVEEWLSRHARRRRITPAQPEVMYQKGVRRPRYNKLRRLGRTPVRSWVLQLHCS